MQQDHMKKQKQKQLLNEESKKKERHIVTWTQEVFLILSYNIINFLFLIYISL